jgi:hypothetical protein
MSSNPQERDVARHLGFGRPRPKLPLPSTLDPTHALSPIFDKLGMNGDGRVAFVGVTDPVLANLRAGAGSRITATVPREPVDVIVYQAESAFALRRIGQLAPLVKRKGCLWVVWPRSHGGINESHIQRTGVAAGLVDVQAVNITPRLVGLKFIRPLREW